MNFGYIVGTASPFDLKGAARLLNMEWLDIHYKPGNWDKVGMLVLFGGEDISTALYGQKPIYTDAPSVMSTRDLMEANALSYAVKRGIPILGICRGAQLACCLLGGKLWQHVEKHEGPDHPVVVKGKEYITNSYHHQQMIPGEGMEIVGVSPQQENIKYGEIPTYDSSGDIEILYHADSRCLMIQGHPEWVGPEHDLFKLTRQLIKEYHGIDCAG